MLTGQVSGGGHPLPIQSPGRWGDLSFQPVGGNIGHDHLTHCSATGQQHHGGQTVQGPTTPQPGPLLCSRHENHHHQKLRQELQDCEWTGCNLHPQPRDSLVIQFPDNERAFLYPVTHAVEGESNITRNPFTHLCQDHLQVTGTEPEASPAVAGLPNCAARPHLHRPLPSPQEGRPHSLAADGHQSAHACWLQTWPALNPLSLSCLFDSSLRWCPLLLPLHASHRMFCKCLGNCPCAKLLPSLSNKHSFLEHSASKKSPTVGLSKSYAEKRLAWCFSLQMSQSTSSSGNSSLLRKTGYNRHFPRSFLLNHRPALQNPSNDVVLSHLHS